jgi:hypothetical protein
MFWSKFEKKLLGDIFLSQTILKEMGQKNVYVYGLIYRLKSLLRSAFLIYGY